VDGTRPQRKRTIKNTWKRKRDPEKEIWRAGYKYSWRKMETAAQNRAEAGEEIVCDGLCSTYCKRLWSYRSM